MRYSLLADVRVVLPFRLLGKISFTSKIGQIFTFILYFPAPYACEVFRYGTFRGSQMQVAICIAGSPRVRLPRHCCCSAGTAQSVTPQATCSTRHASPAAFKHTANSSPCVASARGASPAGRRHGQPSRPTDIAAPHGRAKPAGTGSGYPSSPCSSCLSDWV